MAPNALTAASTGGVWCYQIPGAQHFDFTDYGTYYLAAPIRSLIPLGPADGGGALNTAGTYLTTFADRVTRRGAPPGKPG